MKELSIEEKAKAYDEALERAEKALEVLGTDKCEGARQILSLFPELCESENEKIRKEIIAHCRNTRCVTEEGAERIAKWIAWLEKQGDSPIKWNKNTGGNKPQESHSVLMKTIHGIVEGEWKGEHWLQYRWSSSVKDSDVLYWIEFSNLEKQGEQKPAWSEETDDDAWMNDIISKVENNLQLNKAEIDWLKSLKQRIGG